MKNISEAVKHVGADDLEIELFESQYIVPEGMSYNSYVIIDEKIAVLDTADIRVEKQWKENLSEALGGRTPDYLIVHHMEPDHSALIADMLAMYPEIKIVASAAAIRMMPQFMDAAILEGRTLSVGEGDTLELGSHKLHFIMAPMIHWPEVMMSYESSEGILFSADAFGKFGALETTGGLFCTPETDWACEARRYYVNICGKYGAQVQKLLQKASALDIKTICPLHGPVLGPTIGEALRLYNIWSSYGVESEGVFVAYASIHGNTAEAALKLAEILKEKGAAKVATTDLCRDDMAEAIEDAFRYGRIIVAASSYDGTVFPPMHDFLWHLQIKGWQNRKVGIVENGSWAPCAGRVMAEMLSQMKSIEIVEPKVSIKSRMKESDIQALEALADAILA